MKVRDVMEPDVRTCGPDSNLAEVAAILWEMDCGVVPVVGKGGRIAGVITDRDICMAVGTRPRPASEIRVREVITGNVWACRPEDDLEDALRTMSRKRVRRLPVVDAAGAVVGIVSIADILRRSRQTGSPDLQDVLGTLQAICEPRRLPVGAVSNGWIGGFR